MVAQPWDIRRGQTKPFVLTNNPHAFRHPTINHACAVLYSKPVETRDLIDG